MELKKECPIFINIGKVVKSKYIHMPLKYNVSLFLDDLENQIEALEDIESFSNNLDKIISSSANILIFLDHDLADIIETLCHQINQRIPSIQIKNFILTGSATSGVMVGYPIEIDILLVHTGHFYRYNFKDLVDGLDVAPNKKWTKVSVDEHMAGLCLTLRFADDDNDDDDEEIGVKIDFVPIHWVPISKANLQLTPQARNYLTKNHMTDFVQNNVYTLSCKSNKEFDTGLIENEILKNLDDETKRGYRLAKYPLKFFVHQCDNLHRQPTKQFCVPRSKFNCLSDEDSVKLFGYKEGIKSYFLRIVFLHLILQTQNTDLVDKLKGCRLTLCLLNMMQAIVDTETSKGSFCFEFSHPLLSGATQRLWASKKVCRSIDSVTDIFQHDASTQNFRRYKLLNACCETSDYSIQSSFDKELYLFNVSDYTFPNEETSDSNESDTRNLDKGRSNAKPNVSMKGYEHDSSLCVSHSYA